MEDERDEEREEKPDEGAESEDADAELACVFAPFPPVDPPLSLRVSASVELSSPVVEWTGWTTSFSKLSDIFF